MHEMRSCVMALDLKADLHSYLKGARQTLLWKLDGLDEYDIRRPLTRTGTNLLGLVKHSAGTNLRYFGAVFGRSTDLSASWLSRHHEPNSEMWALPQESRDDIVGLYRQTWDIADEAITELSLDTVSKVPWWGAEDVTLHHVLVHVTAETQRHAGHADIIRELIDGSAGLLEGHDNLPVSDLAWWDLHCRQVEEAARLASDR